MADEAAVPQIADISTPAPQQSSALDTALSQVSRAASAPLPQAYTQGTQVSQPSLPPVQHVAPMNANTQPISMQVQDLKRARHQNALASMSNSIHQFVEQTEQKKQDTLKTKLVDVMQAKQNVANAQAVLQQDPNNKIAQGVMAANKKRMNDILSDPKNQKQMQKALDISFVDPQQNKTPEVQAFQQAHKEVQAAGPYNAGNPAEAQVAKMAQGGGKPQQPPQQQARPQQQSATPRADAALAKDLPTIEQNPNYAPALAQKQAAQKALWTDIIPKAMQQQTDMWKIQAQQAGTTARANLAAQMAAYKLNQQHIDKMDEIGAVGKNQMKVENARAASAMANTMARVNAAKQLASNKQMDPANRLKIQTETMATIDRSITGKVQNNAGLAAQMANPNATDDQKKLLQAQIDMNNKDIEQTQQYRQKEAKEFYGITGQAPAAPVQTGNQPQGAGWFKQFTGSDAANVLGGSAGTVGTGVANAGSNGSAAASGESRPNVEVVGRDASSNAPDSDSDDSGTSAEDQATIDSILNESN